MMLDGVAAQVRAVTLEGMVTPVTEMAAMLSTAINPEAVSLEAARARATTRVLEPAKMVVSIRATAGPSSIAVET